jgi:hypothetical protein
VSWQYNVQQPSTVFIEVSSDGGQTWEIVEANIQNTGSYTWDVPQSNGTTYRLRVVPAEGSDIVYAETEDFEIDSNPPTPSSVVSNNEFSLTNLLSTIQINEDDDNSIDLSSLFPGEQGLQISPQNSGASEQGGLVTCSGTTCSYTSSENYSGTDSFSFIAIDAAGNESSIITVNFPVTAVNDAPQFTTISDISAQEDTSKSNVASFTISDVDSTVDCATHVAVSSNDQSLVQDSNITVNGGATTTCDISFAPEANANGQAIFTVTATDSEGASNSTSFTVTIQPVDDAPVITAIADESTVEDTPAIGIAAFSLSDIDTNIECQTHVSVTSSSQSLVQDSGISVQGGTTTSCTLNVTPELNQSGVATITVTVNDGTTSVNKNFDLTVTADNDAPVISTVSDFSGLEDTAQSTVATFTIADVDSSVECGTHVTVVSSNQSVVADGAISINGGAGQSCSLDFTPVANTTGSTTFTITATDSLTASSTETFVYTVNPDNDAPTISAIGDESTNEDTNLSAIAAFTIADIDSTVDCQNNISVSSSNTSVIANSSIVVNGGTGTSCTLDLSPETDAFGTSTITVTVNDGTDSSSTTFDLTVNAQNDAPTVTTISNFNNDEDVTMNNVASFTIADVDNTIECGTHVSVSSSNQSLMNDSNITVNGGTGSSCDLNLTPEPNANGTVTITVDVNDGSGGTATETFDLTLNAVNDAPVIVFSQTAMTIKSGTTQSNVSISATPGGGSDESSQTLTLSCSSSGSNVTFSGCGTLTAGTEQFDIIVAGGFEGVETVTLTITDDGTPAESSTVQFIVEGIQYKQLSHSLRFPSSSKLERSFSSGNGQTFTVSFWVKHSGEGAWVTTTDSYAFAYGISGAGSVQIRQNVNHNMVSDTLLVMTKRSLEQGIWYHIHFIIDTTEPVEDDRIKLSIDGQRVTDFSLYTPPSLNLNTSYNRNAHRYYGNYANSAIAEVYSIEGNIVQADAFGVRSADGVWYPKDPSSEIAAAGGYGTRGYHLDFSNDANIGEDQSGQGNHFTDTSVGIANRHSDVPHQSTATIISPRNMRPYSLAAPSQNVATGQGFDFTTASSVASRKRLKSIYSLDPTDSEGYYFEATFDAGADASRIEVGLFDTKIDLSTTSTTEQLGSDTDTTANAWNYANDKFHENQTSSSALSTISNGQTIQIAVKNSKMYVGVNDTWLGSGDPVNELNPLNSVDISTIVKPLLGTYDTGQLTMNFGHKPYAYTKPTGYKDMVLQNMRSDIQEYYELIRKRSGDYRFTSNSDGLIDVFSDNSGLQGGATYHWNHIDRVMSNQWFFSLAPGAGPDLTTPFNNPTDGQAVVSATNEYSYRSGAAWILFSDNEAAWRNRGFNQWYTSGGSSIITYNFGSHETVHSYTLVSEPYAPRTPNTFTFQGYDGSSWITLDSQSGLDQTYWTNAGFTQTFNIASPSAYLQYRVNVSSHNGDPTHLLFTQMAFHGAVPVDVDMSLESATVAASSEPSSVVLKILASNLDSAVVNTDFTASVSCDDGATYQTVTLSEGDILDQNLARFYTANQAITCAGGETNMRYKVDAINNKRVDVYAIKMSWQ